MPQSFAPTLAAKLRATRWSLPSCARTCACFENIEQLASKCSLLL